MAKLKSPLVAKWKSPLLAVDQLVVGCPPVRVLASRMR
jgi:hypothetical protein